VNVLLITTDQRRADTLGPWNAAVPVTPNLDALAKHGVVFGDAHCQHPYCQPSRWTILTGQHPRRHGVWTNGVDPTARQLADALSTRAVEAGVATAFVGKAHLATNGVFRRSRSPYMETIANSRHMKDDWYGPYMGFEHVELLQLGHFPFGYGPAPLGLHYGRFLASHGGALRNFLRAAPRRALVGSPRAPQTWHSSLPEELHPTTWVADRTIERLRALRGRPFFLWCSFADPHHPFDPPAPWCRRVDPADVRLPRRDVRELDDKPPWQKRFALGLGLFARALNTPGASVSDRELAIMIAAYLGLVAQLDHQVGRILRALEQEGLADDTAVFFTTDHGELLGDHALLFKGPFHYDGLVRVPLIARVPGWPSGARVDDPVGTIDLAPTFERLLGVRAGARVQGEDLAPLLSGGRRDAALCENDHRIGFREHVQTLVTRDYKLNRHVGRAYGEIYDRRADPGETRNLFHDAALRARLEAQLDDVLPPLDEPQRAPVGLLPA